MASHGRLYVFRIRSEMERKELLELVKSWRCRIAHEWEEEHVLLVRLSPEQRAELGDLEEL